MIVFVVTWILSVTLQAQDPQELIRTATEDVRSNPGNVGFWILEAERADDPLVGSFFASVLSLYRNDFQGALDRLERARLESRISSTLHEWIRTHSSITPITLRDRAWLFVTADNDNPTMEGVVQTVLDGLARLHCLDLSGSSIVLVEPGHHVDVDREVESPIHLYLVTTGNDPLELAESLVKVALPDADPDARRSLAHYLAFSSHLLTATAGKTLSSFASAAHARFVHETHGPAMLKSWVLGEAHIDLPENSESLRADPPPGSVRFEHVGHACIRLTAADATRLIVDPFSRWYWLGVAFPWVTADAVVATHAHADHDAIDELAGWPRRILQSLDGEIPDIQEASVGSILVRGLKTQHDTRYGTTPNVVLLIEADGLILAHLGDLEWPLPKNAIETLRDVDILLAPIDDEAHILDAATLDEITSTLSPRVLVPIHYEMSEIGVDAKKLGSIQKWLQGRGSVRSFTGDWTLISKSELPEKPEVWVFAHPAWPQGRLERSRSPWR